MFFFCIENPVDVSGNSIVLLVEMQYLKLD